MEFEPVGHALSKVGIIKILNYSSATGRTE